MADKYGISESEYQLIQKQAARRAEMRQEFLKQRTNPWKNAAEAGYVFDAGHQRFVSMKVTQFDFFQPNRRTALFGIGAIIIPMFTYGYLIYNERSGREQKIRSGKYATRIDYSNSVKMWSVKTLADV